MSLTSTYLAPAAAIVLAGVAAPITHLVHAAEPVEAGAPVLVIAPPWVALDDAIAGAGGQSIGPTAAPLARLATGDADFLQRLQANRSIWIGDGRAIAALCGVGAQNT